MTVYQEEKRYLKNFKDKILSGKDITQEEIIELIEKFEEMTEITTVTTKIIDRLMMNYDKLKQELDSEEKDQKKDTFKL